MNKNYNYNKLVRFYNRSQKKLCKLIALGKNLYKQDILKRRLARLYELLIGVQTNLKLSTVSVALATGFILFSPDAVKAQNYPAMVSNPFNLTNVGANWSAAGLTDLDNDGDKDLLAGDKTGAFKYYKNVGTASTPNFTVSVLNPYGLTTLPSASYSTIAFVDLDNDGDKDMLSGDGAGDFYYYKNTGTASVPSFTTPVMNPYGLTNVATTYSWPTFVDLDNDGDKDIMSGDKNGDFYYFQNNGTAALPAFGAQQMNFFGLVITGGKYSTPAFADLDGDGDKDLMSGRNDGSFSYYQNNGTPTVPAFFAPVVDPFSLTPSTNGGSTPTFVDLDNDSDMDIMTGEAYGDLIYYENTAPLAIKNNNLFTGLNISPNPTVNDVTVHFKNSNENLTIEVSNSIGQVVSLTKTNFETNTIALPEAKGLYFIKITNALNESNLYKIVKE